MQQSVGLVGGSILYLNLTLYHTVDIIKNAQVLQHLVGGYHESQG